MACINRCKTATALALLIFTFISFSGTTRVFGETLYETAKRLQAEELEKKRGEVKPHDEEKKKADFREMGKGFYKVTVFDFENFTDNPDNNYLYPVVTFNLIQNLKRSSQLTVESTQTAGASKEPEMGDFSQYKTALYSLKSVAALYSSDFIVTGYYLIKGDTVTVVSDLYISRQDSVKNFIVSKENYKNTINDAVMELSIKIEAEILRNLLAAEAAVASEAVEEEKEEVSKRFPGRKLNFGISLSYGYVSTTPEWRNSAFLSDETRIMTLQFFWNLSHVKSVRKIVFVRDLSLFLQMDMFQGFLRKDIFDSNETPGSFRFHSYGILAGLMYRFEFHKNFSFNVDTGLGFARSQTSSDMSEKFRFIGYLVPPEKDHESYDLYYGLSVSFNIFIIKYVFLTANVSFKLFVYSPELLYALTYQGGIGFRF